MKGSTLFNDVSTDNWNSLMWVDNDTTDAVFLYDVSTPLGDNISQHFNSKEANDYDDLGERFNPVIYCSILSVITTVGVIGNLLIIVIFSVKQNRKRSCSVYLRALAVSDSIVLLTTLTDDVITRLLDVDILYGNRYICSSYLLWNIFWEHFSAGLLVLVALDRYIAVAYPLKRAFLCSHKRAIYITLGTALSCICLNLYEIIWNEVETKSREDDVDWEYDCPVVDSLEFGMLSAVHKFVFILLIPFCVVLVLNLRVIYLIKTSLRAKQNRNSVSLARATLPIINVTLSSLFFLFPLLLVQVMEFGIIWIDISPELQYNIETAWDVTKVVSLLNYTLNFYILVMFTKSYIYTLKHACCCTKPTIKQ